MPAVSWNSITDLMDQATSVASQSINPAPVPTPAPVPAPMPMTTQDLVEAYSQPAAQMAPTIPQWENVLPWQNVWGGMEPTMMQAAFGQVTPEVMRNYLGAYRDYMSGMASSGGGRFGRGWGGVGSLQASAERQRKESAADYMTQYEQAVREWYDRTGEEYRRAREAGDVYDYTVPTWEEFHKQVSPMSAPSMQEDWMISPFTGGYSYQPPTQGPSQSAVQPMGLYGETRAPRVNRRSMIREERPAEPSKSSYF
jgi:hypothetical protein